MRLAAIVALGASCAAAPAGKTAAPAPPVSGEAPFVLHGYVVESYRCPPCPPNAQCEACEDYLIVSNEREPASRSMTAPTPSTIP